MFFFPMTPKGWAIRKVAKKLYAIAVQRAREPVFYESLNVPDTLDGRFEMIALHTGLIINRVRNEGKAGHRLAQAIFDEMFLNMELSCRQVGIGDLSVPKHIKRMMKALQGRALTYEQAGTQEGLMQALIKNLYATTETPPQSALNEMSVYVIASRDTLKTQKFEEIQSGQCAFAELPKGNTYVENSKVA